MMRADFRDGDRLRSVELEPKAAGSWRAVVDGVEVTLAVERLERGRLRLVVENGAVTAEVTIAGSRRFVRLGNLDFVFERETGTRRGRGSAHAATGLEAPMPGLVTRVLAAPGDRVKKGQPLVALEAMKMEHMIRAPREGRVKRVLAESGEMVAGGATLVELEESAESR